jgi:ATP-dependent DNA ligase
VPFSHPDWIFEVKWDGFRAILYSDETGMRLVSRNGNTFKSFPRLCEGLARDLKGRRCVLDGEIVCLETDGKPQFRDLLFRVPSLSFTLSTSSGMNMQKPTITRKTADSKTGKTFGTCR